MQRPFFSIASFAKAHRRSAAWAAGALAVLAFFLYVIVPFVASTRIVKERIAFEMSMWSGYNVTISEDARVKLFPFRAVLTNVEMAEWTHDGPPVLAADEVILNLSPFAALIGDIFFYKVRFEGFTLRVKRNEGEVYLPRLPGGGRMANAIKDARVLSAAMSETEDLSSLGGEPFGRLHFTRGRIVDEATDEEIVTKVDGALVWPRLDKSASLIANGVWHGEAVAIDLAAAEPMALLTGEASQASLSVTGRPGSITFDGAVNFSRQPYFNGHAAFSTSSLRRMFEWSGADIGASPSASAIKVESRVQATPDRIKFEELQLAFDGRNGTGVVELLLDQKRPALSGTLALQQLNLDFLLSVFSTMSIDPTTPRDRSDTAFVDRFDLDLRVSATQASAGFMTMADVAATAQIRDGLAVFDISDAKAFGGTIQAGLRLDRSEGGTEVETSLRAMEIDGGTFGQAVGLARVLPDSRGNISVMLKGPVESWDTFADGLSGTFSAEFGPGTFPRLDLPAFLAKTREGGFFPLAEVATNTLAIDRLQVKGDISHSIAHLDRAEIRSGQHLIDLSGVVSFAGRGLALTGSVRDAQNAGAAGTPVAGFFVGGTWSEPFISPAASATSLN